MVGYACSWSSDATLRLDAVEVYACGYCSDVLLRLLPGPFQSAACFNAEDNMIHNYNYNNDNNEMTVVALT